MRVALAVLTLAACGTPAHPVVPTGPGSGSAADPVGSASTAATCSGAATSLPIVVDGSGASAQLGRDAVVRGIARDAKLGPVIVASDLVVYCLESGNWSAERSGHPVAACGTLEQTDAFASHTGSGGEVSAGTAGPIWVLRRCTPLPE
jgi:hypothetical protein